MRREAASNIQTWMKYEGRGSGRGKRRWLISERKPSKRADHPLLKQKGRRQFTAQSRMRRSFLSTPSLLLPGYTCLAPRSNQGGERLEASLRAMNRVGISRSKLSLVMAGDDDTISILAMYACPIVLLLLQGRDQGLASSLAN